MGEIHRQRIKILRNEAMNYLPRTMIDGVQPANETYLILTAFSPILVLQSGWKMEG